MKWRTKRFIYSYNNALNDISNESFLFMLKGFLHFNMLVFLLFFAANIFNQLTRQETMNQKIFLISLVSFHGTIFSVFVIVPLLLGVLAKRDSYKKQPILKQLKTIQELSSGSNNGDKGLNTERIVKLEGSFLEENKYPATEEIIRKYELEINHICELAHKKKHFESAIIEHAVLRSNSIISEIVEGMELDEQAYKKSILIKKEEIANEWTDTYSKE